MVLLLIIHCLLLFLLFMSGFVLICSAKFLGLQSKNRPPDKSVPENYFSYFSTKTYIVGTQKNRLDETVLLSTQNTCLDL